MDDVLQRLPDFAGETPLWLALLATLAGAMQGTLRGRQAAPRVDIAGAAILALSVGFGGGLIRDILIGNTPPEALRRWEYTAVVAIGFALVLLFGRRIARFRSTLFWLDTLTLGLFAAVGAQYAINFGLPTLTAILVGTFASVAGGLAAALLLREQPEIMRPGPPYVIASLAGAIAFVMLDGVNGGLASLAAVAVVAAIRYAVRARGVETSPIRPLD
jgi:uncharacterized membrane protein YeiH